MLGERNCLLPKTDGLAVLVFYMGASGLANAAAAKMVVTARNRAVRCRMQ
jgi:hypothetical protein